MRGILVRTKAFLNGYALTTKDGRLRRQLYEMIQDIDRVNQ